MTLNRELFAKDPLSFDIPNLGVTRVGRPNTANEWNVLRYELTSFVCEGEYERGLQRILQTYLDHQGQEQQPAVWISGFYGSGKSHLVRVLDALWTDIQFPDGATARGLVNLTPDIRDALLEITNSGKRGGGLWSAAGTLGADAGAAVRTAVLGIVLRSAGMPERLAPARFMFWLLDNGYLEGVEEHISGAGKSLESELRNMYVSPALADALLKTAPDLAQDQASVHQLLKTQYPPTTDETSGEDFEATLRRVLEAQSTKAGELPNTLIVLDELQQYLNNNLTNTLAIDDAAKSISESFGSKVLLIATGQMQLGATPELQRLTDRFLVKVALSDQDVEKVVRSVVLRKDEGKRPALRAVLDRVAGEIDRHLAGTRIGAKPADREDLEADYPLLPTRRRFWESVLRSVDSAGKAGQLRTQLRVVHEASRMVAEKPVGYIVGGDLIYSQQLAELQMSGVLPRDTATLIAALDDETDEGLLKSRIAALAFLIGKLDREGPTAPGIKATPDTFADLLVEDLPAGSAQIRQRVTAALESLVQDGLLIQVEGEYSLQTPESAEWQQEFQRRQKAVINDDARIADERASIIRKELETSLGSIRPLQGKSKVPRKVVFHFRDDPPPSDDTLPVWIRDEWSTSEKEVRDDARAAGTASHVVYVHVPRLESDAIRQAIADRLAATEVINSRPAPTTPEGMEAQLSMQTRRDLASEKLVGLVRTVIRDSKVYQGGGNEVQTSSLAESVRTAVEASMVRRFSTFAMADHPSWGTVIQRVKQGAPDPLTVVDHRGEAEQHPVVAEVRRAIGGAGKKGREIHQAFEAPPYGWPKDAVDASLLVLLRFGQVRAKLNGQPAQADQLPQNQIGSAEFTAESTVIGADMKLALRKLAADTAIPASPGQELTLPPQIVQKLVEVGARAGGEAPLPAPPSSELLSSLQNLYGNEQAQATYDARDQIAALHRQWSEQETTKQLRLEQWGMAQRLALHAASAGLAPGAQAQLEAIRYNRSLLEHPDPVAPIVGDLATALRDALSSGLADLNQRIDEARVALQQDAGWAKLEEGEQARILAEAGFQPIDSPSVGDVSALVAFLDETSLTDLKDRTDAIPQRLVRARTAVAQATKPQAKVVRLKRATIQDGAELERYLDSLRTDIEAELGPETPVIVE
jgi:hypothetical protein